MTRADFNNSICWDWWGKICDNNGIAIEVPCLNPRSWSTPDFNPPGDVPELNPKEYINPLTGRDSSGPLDFS